MLLLAVVGLGGISRNAQARRLYTSAHQFVSYFRALERTEQQVGFWDKVTLSLVLTGTDSNETQCP